STPALWADAWPDALPDVSRAKMKIRNFLILLICCIAAKSNALAGPATDTTMLAQDKKALLPIIISPQAGAKTREVAQELAVYLGRITEASFEVRPGNGSEGIVLGTLAEFPVAALGKALE